MTRPRWSSPSGLNTRTSADDRDAVVTLLSDAYAGGRLEPEEYQARLDQAMRTGTYAELYRVLDGLPVDPRRLPRPPRPRRPRWVVPAVVGGVLVMGAGAALLLAPPSERDASGGTFPVDDPATSPSPSWSAMPDASPTASAPTPSPASPARSPSPTATASPATPREDTSADSGGPAEPSGQRVTPATRSGAGTAIVTVPWVADVAPMIEFEVERDDFELFVLADVDGNPFFTYVDADGRGGRVAGATVMPDYEVPTSDRLRLKVETSGSWTLTLSDVADAPELPRSATGSGYEVGWYDGPEVVLSMTADEGNFAVWDDVRLVINGIGPERDEGVIEAGRRLLRIEADSAWRYEMR